MYNSPISTLLLYEDNWHTSYRHFYLSLEKSINGKKQGHVIHNAK